MDQKVTLSILFFVGLFGLSMSFNCTSCATEKCSHPVDCFAGVIKDRCGCCLICGQREGYRCFEPKLRGKLDSKFEEYGACGENLECRIRDDLAENEPAEALCYCKKTEMVCGTDGNTYDNICHLMEARLKRRDGLAAATSGPCRAAPKIVQKPKNFNSSLGAKVAFMCEVSGWPVPKVSWKVMKKHSHKVHYIDDLPSDDPHIVVQSRGGAKNLEVTSWLQIIGVKSDDEGEYHCMASNDMGEDNSYAVLSVLQSAKKPIKLSKNPKKKAVLKDKE